MIRWLLVALVLAGCRAQKAASRDQDLRECSYVYPTEAGLRECLVMQRGWPVDAAVGAIARLKVRTDSIRDSLQSISDSVAGAAHLETQRRRDSQ